MSQQRQVLLKRVKTVVVKVGTAVLADSDGRIHRRRISSLARQMSGLRERGMRVVLVSSGAIGAGMGHLGLRERPNNVPQLQAAAAVGQGKLMRAYDEAFRRYGLATGQVLLTRDDFNDRLRYLNARNTIFALLEFGVVPIINENDTTSVEEITFGDNDFLAGQVTNLLRAGLLVILTVVDGLRRRGAGGRLGERIDVVEEVTGEVLALASEEATALGRGGMTSKLQAAQMATRAGEAVIVADGTRRDALSTIFTGQPTGTLFLPSPKRMKSRKRWIGFGVRPRGRICVDAGARKALAQRGKSLLPSGMIGVEGSFQRGDVVELEDDGGEVFGRGLINYGAEEALRLRGLKTSQIAGVLGSRPYDEIIHRDNLVIFPEGPATDQRP